MWRCPQRPSLGDRRDVWRNKMVNSLYLLTYPVGVRIDELDPERERPVNFSGSVNQRFGEFWREISGCGRNLEGPFRTPEVLSRNRERRADGQIDANPCGNGPKTQNARQPISRRRALTGLAFLSVESKQAPRTKLSSKRLARDRFSQVLISKAVADFESLSVARISNATASETATGWLTVRSRSC